MPSRPHRVIVAGGCFAAAEALLALRAFASDDVELELVTPDPELRFRPAATAVAFEPPLEQRLASSVAVAAYAPPEAPAVPSFDLTALAARTGARIRRDLVEAVAPDVRRVRLATGAQLEYDSLVLAVGARARSAIPGALTFRDHRDAALVARIAEDVRSGAIDNLVVAVPPATGWPLPAYEIALLAAREAEEAGSHTRVSLVTPERMPLEIFGWGASLAVADALEDRGVQVIRGAVPRRAGRHALRLADGSAVPADRVLTTPALRGRRIAGVPANFGGFVPTDTAGRVIGLDGVYAAGDMTDFPVKQGGLAAQQAEAIAATIAGIATGARPEPVPALRVLRAQLFGAPSPLYLQGELDERGRPVPECSWAFDEPQWWPATTVFGRHVTPWMAEQAVA